MLHRVVRAHWPAFLERAEEAGGLPRFVVRELEEYLECGLLEHGLVHLRCGQCGEDLVVAWSCKRRGFCPSCVARRMSDAAAHLVDDVLPEVPARQWVCALPWRLRVLLGYDRRLCAEVLSAFTGAVSRSLRASPRIVRSAPNTPLHERGEGECVQLAHGTGEAGVDRFATHTRSAGAGVLQQGVFTSPPTSYEAHSLPSP